MPVSWLFCALVFLRRLLFRLGLISSSALTVPVIVVGNINVGGSGKTPLVIWLARQLIQAGYKPGIMLRGYGGKAEQWPQQVRPDSDPIQVGDEAVLLAQRTGCPVCAGPNRVEDGRALLEHTDCDVILCDDGLQHYRLRRDFEIAVVDGRRRFGNGLCLPAGPLREGLRRLKQVDWIVANGRPERGEYAMRLTGLQVCNLMTGEEQPLIKWQGKQVRAIAGIGDPVRFFSFLRQAGLIVEDLAFADHHQYIETDFDSVDSSSDARPLLMTEKDAVKCVAFARDNWWFLPVEAELDSRLGPLIIKKLKKLQHG